MRAFLTYAFMPGDIQCGLIAALLFMLPLRKRKGFVWRFLVSSAAALLTSVRLLLLSRFYVLIQDPPVLSLFPSIFLHEIVFTSLQLLVLTAVFRFCCDLPLSQHMYGAVCALVSETLAYLVYLVVLPQAGYRVIGHIRSEYPWIELPALAAVYAFIYFFIAARLPKNGEFLSPSRAPMPFVVLLLTRSLGSYSRLINTKPEYFRILLVASVMLCMGILASQKHIRMLHEWQQIASFESRLRKAQQQEYQRYRADVDTVRRMGHDLKHMLSALRQEGSSQRQTEIFAEIEDALAAYEAHMDTGNDTLDALLSGAWQRCRSRGVKWTCLADGSALQSVDPMDLFVLLGNALDNAVENAARVTDPAKRFLSLNIWQQNGIAILKLENYCQTEPVFSDGFPVTTKADPDNHGYGVRSIRAVVERYGGELSMSVKDHVFSLDVLLPLGKNEK